MTLLQFLFMLFLYSNHVDYASISVHAQFSQISSNNEDNLTLSQNNSTKCPSVWYKYNSATQDCQCIPLKSLTCDGEHVYADIHRMLTYNADKGVITDFKLRHKHLQGYNTTDEGLYILLPNNVSELNHYMCGPLNRKGYMCKECKNGYGPAAVYQSMSCSGMCYVCKGMWRHLLLYLIFNFIPLTLFYLLILAFQVRLTSAPMICFIMYSQVVVLAFFGECGLDPANTSFGDIKLTYTEGTIRAGTVIFLTLYGVFNLDFFHYTQSPFCLSSKLRPIHIFSLGYISAFYPFLLILLTWLCVELHGRNFRPIVCLWKPFHGCFVRLRRGWNTKSDLIDVFASFFLLSYCKLLYLIVLTFDFEEVIDYTLTKGHETHRYVLASDFSINTLMTKDCYYILLTCFVVMLVFFFLTFPVLLLLIYPIKSFRNLLSKCCSIRLLIFLNTFIEKFHCCYRDGLGGTKDMRSLSGVHFLLRIVIFCTSTLTKATFRFDPILVQGFIFSITALLIALGRPYKKMYMNIADSVLLLHMATLCYIMESMASQSSRPPHYLQLVQIIISLPFMVVFLLSIYSCISKCGIIRHFRHLLSSLKGAVRIKLYGNLITETQAVATYGTINYSNKNV